MPHLVLSRRENEEIQVFTSDGTVTIRVERASDRKVKLGILAPSQVKVLRQEIVRKLCPPSQECTSA